MSTRTVRTRSFSMTALLVPEGILHPVCQRYVLSGGLVDERIRGYGQQSELRTTTATYCSTLLCQAHPQQDVRLVYRKPCRFQSYQPEILTELANPLVLQHSTYSRRDSAASGQMPFDTNLSSKYHHRHNNKNSKKPFRAPATTTATATANTA